MHKNLTDIEKLDKRIKDFKSDNQKSTSNEKITKKETAYQLGIRIATDLVSGIIVGAGLGYIADKTFNTHPVMLIIFLIFGSAAGFLNVYRFAKSKNITRTTTNG
jgi:ATP synthase protein I